jgi:hypothetical protein
MCTASMHPQAPTTTYAVETAYAREQRPLDTVEGGGTVVVNWRPPARWPQVLVVGIDSRDLTGRFQWSVS